jgi:hypothetical protein
MAKSAKKKKKNLTLAWLQFLAIALALAWLQFLALALALVRL